ncbi:Thioredoxin family protein [Histomonas meleagridis]|uniref:Thioredoxin family protein n=1 Tax=Histomonas meleagridis TaxID=135588 RepID=UPI003559CBCD|nr:Thioredoxin family protein [Histomonas meleagridis]KAH0805401.1 Thioredoxin family protein [Histomonas meleagridis]
MLVFFTSIVASIYVPISKTAKQNVPFYSIEKAKEIANKTKYFFLLGYNPRESHDTINSFKRISGYFSGHKDVKFAVLNPRDAKNFSKSHKVDLDCLFLFIGGEYITAYSYPNDDSTLLYLIDYLLYPDITPIQTLRELATSIGSSPFSILTPETLYEDALSLHFRAAKVTGPINIYVLTDSLLEEIGLNSSTLGFFRTEDLAIVPQSKSTTDLYSNTFPVYVMLTSDDLTQDNVFIALVDDSLTREYDQFLFSVGESNPDFTVGFLTLELFLKLQRKMNIPLPNTPMMLFFNGLRRYTYNISSLFDTLYSNEFNSSLWEVKCNEALDLLRNNSLERNIYSEEIPHEQENNNVIKLVGYTYDEFVNDPTNDVVIFYTSDECTVCNDFLNMFINVAQELNNNSLKFGYINRNKNSVKSGFPIMHSLPHIHIFPTNKTNHQALRGDKTRDNLLRLIKMYATNELNIEIQEIDRTKAARDLLELLYKVAEEPEDEQERMFDWIQKISDILEQFDDKEEENEKKVNENEDKAKGENKEKVNENPNVEL